MPTPTLQTVRLTWLLPDGCAGGRLEDGEPVRVAGGLPGDEVRITLSERTNRRGPVEGRLEALLVPSEHRRAPLCPVSTRCGGCGLDQLHPAGREAALVPMVARAYGWQGAVGFVAAASRADSGYRARIKLAIQDGQLGYREARSHTLVPVTDCGIARPEVRVAAEAVAAWLGSHDGAGLESVELRSDGCRVVANFTGGSVPQKAALAGLGDVAFNGTRLAGNPTLMLDGPVPLRASAGSFYQVNLEVNALLQQHVEEAVLAASPERVLDLYAGIGNLGLPLAKKGVPLLSVEAPGPGAEDARFNARPFANAEVLAVDVRRFDASRTPFDVVILDPPRSGAPGVLKGVGRSRPKRIIYVSCHAQNAARDLKELVGYKLVALTVFDLFPDTPHVESVVTLERQ